MQINRAVFFFWVILGLGFILASPPDFASAQQDNFDSLAVPALPLEWESHTSANAPQFLSVDSTSDTAPICLYVQGYAGVNRTQLHSPPFFIPRVPTQLTFRHKFSLEKSGNTAYDGAQLFFVPGSIGYYGAEYEWTRQGGTFTSGGYNGVISGSASTTIIPGQSAWTGNQSSFMTTVANLPAASPDYSFAQLAWALFSDVIIASPGWWIDTVSLSPAADISVTQTSNLASAAFGHQLLITTTVINSSEVPATNIKLHQTLPQDVSVAAITLPSGGYVQGPHSLDFSLPVVDGNSSLSITLLVNVPLAVTPAAFLEVLEGYALERTVYPLRRLPFTTESIVGVYGTQLVDSFDFVGITNDGCEGQALGSFAQGRIGVARGAGCTLETKVKNLQQAGEVAAIILDASNDPIPPEGSSAGINIPGFLAARDAGALLSMSAGSGRNINLGYVANTLHFTAKVLADQFDPAGFNNNSSLLLGVQADSLSPRFKANLKKAQKLLSGLAISSNAKTKKKMKANAAKLKVLSDETLGLSVSAAFLAGKPAIAPAMTKLKAALYRAARLSAKNFSSDKSKAATQLQKLLKQLR